MKASSFFHAVMAGLMAACAAHHAQAFSLTPGDIYTSNYSHTINQYDSSGVFIDSLTIPTSIGREIKGLAFGDNGLLYAVAATSSAYQVVALDATGTVRESYEGQGYMSGNVAYGKIAFGANGTFYVAGSGNLVAFNRGEAQGTIIHTGNDMFDVEVLPSGNLLSLSAYGLQELSPTGALVRNINTSVRLVDARGVEFDPATGDVYVTMLGYTGQSFRLMRFDALSGQVEASEYFWYGNDMFLLEDGRLLVGSWTENPGLFDRDLVRLGSVGIQQQMFVTQMPFAVPESGTAVMMLGGLLAIACVKRRRPCVAVDDPKA